MDSDEIKVTVWKMPISSVEKVYIEGLASFVVALDLERAWEIANKILIAIDQYRAKEK